MSVKGGKRAYLDGSGSVISVQILVLAIMYLNFLMQLGAQNKVKAKVIIRFSITKLTYDLLMSGSRSGSETRRFGKI
jgi:hypothetical protein